MVIREEKQENKVWRDLFNNKMAGLIVILGHRLRWDEIQSNACTTCSKEVLIRNLGFPCHYSENKIILVYKFLMHVQLCCGIFSTYMW